MAEDQWGFEPFTAEDPIADIEVALMDYLAPAGRTVTQLMSWDKEGDLPAIRIQRIGGGQGEDPETTDLPRVLINCYARPTPESPRASQRVAADVVRRMTAIHGVWVEGAGLLDSATKDSGPVTRPWDDPAIRVTELIYSVTVRI
jgi:hypothetical protein